MSSVSSLSGNKDTDREILLAMSDKELIQTCSLNKYLFKFVCDDNFFYRKLVRSYPDTLKDFNKEKDKTYKSYYLKVVFYVAKLLEDFKHTYVSGNPKKQNNLFAMVSKKIEKDGSKKFIVDYQDLLNDSAAQGELELVKEAIKKGASIHREDNYALRLASKSGHLDIIKYLVSLGANIHAKDEYALRYASLNGHLDVVKYLVEYTPPISSGNLVENGANIHILNEETLTWAVLNGHLDVVKYLVSQGADVHADDDQALKWANEMGHEEIIKYLKSLP